MTFHCFQPRGLSKRDIGLVFQHRRKAHFPQRQEFLPNFDGVWTEFSSCKVARNVQENSQGSRILLGSGVGESTTYLSQG